MGISRATDRAGAIDVLPDATTPTVLLAEDDADFRFLVREAFQAAGIKAGIRLVENGQELLDYLRRDGKYSHRRGPLPRLILLDLEMPGLGGHATLRQLKADRRLQRIPTVILTSSSSSPEFERAYASGAISFMTKPDSFKMLVRYVTSLTHHLQSEGRPSSSEGAVRVRKTGFKPRHK
ncbi:MAG: response regulator [Candidatus Eisenbacteria bacterium]